MVARVRVPKDISKLLRNLLIGIAALTLVIVLSGVAISYTSGRDVSEAIFYTAGSLTKADLTGAATPGTKVVMMFLGFFGTVLSFYVFWLFIDYFLTGKFNEHLTGVRDMSRLKSLKGHCIICGAGRVGEHVGEKLKKEGMEVVFLEKDDTRVGELKHLGFTVFNADALNEENLKAVGIEGAACLAAVLGEDGDNLLIILTARELNPNIRIASRANDETIVSKLQHAGADMVILPEVLGGIKLADALMGKVDTDHVVH